MRKLRKKTADSTAAQHTVAYTLQKEGKPQKPLLKKPEKLSEKKMKGWEMCTSITG